MTNPSTQEELLAALALSRRPRVGAATFKKLILSYKKPTLALQYHLSLPKKVFNSHQKKSETKEGLKLARKYLEEGGQALYAGGPEYPLSLMELGEPPPVLFVRGDLQILQKPLIAIVGARQADQKSLLLTRRISQIAIENGFTIVSGGARGVDATAHQEALNLKKPTIAVLGTGIDVVYPKEHKALFSQIASRGLLLTELLPQTPPARGFFLTRNRIIAGLGKAVIAVCGQEKSGALTTCRWAFQLSRPVASFSMPSENPLSALSLILQQKGATLLPTDAFSEIAKWFQSILALE